MKKLVVFIFSLLISSHIFSYERSDAFIVRAYEKSYKVLSPPKYQGNTNLIVENKTSVKLLGKVEIEDGKRLGHLAIRPGGYDTIVLKSKKGDKLFFVPLSPPFQKFELKFGKKPYEIPSKK